MRIRIEYTLNVTDKTRLAIARLMKHPGLADRDEVKRFFKMYGDCGWDLIAEEFGVINAEAKDLARRLGATT